MKLEKGEVICPTCNNDPDKLDIWYPIFNGKKLCPKCKGAGKLDWIENVVGKKEVPFHSGVSHWHSFYSPIVKEENKLGIIIDNITA